MQESNLLFPKGELNPITKVIAALAKLLGIRFGTSSRTVVAHIHPQKFLCTLILPKYKKFITEKNVRTYQSPHIFCFSSLSRINFTNPIGASAFIIGPNDKTRITISVSSLTS